MFMVRARYGPLARIAFELGEAEFDYSNPGVCHGSGGGGTNTVTSSAPPPQVMAAYQTALTAGQTAAAAPLQQYNAPTIAGFTPDQTSAFGAVDAAQGSATPYYNQASTDINAGTSNLWNGVQQFSPSTIASYQNPYTSQVLNSTMAAENNQDAQQQSALQGNAVSSGAWGGDRAGVASAVLSGQQDIANNQTNANIENQGFTGAESEFNTEQQSQLGANEANNYLSEQAGLGQANLGSTVENTALQGANAQEASGAIQQQLGQAALNVPYEQFQQQQAYPFQTAQYFANIAEGLGANAGGLGSSSTTASSPSVASQVAGFGLGGLGIAGASGAFDSSASPASSALSARGGRIYAMGGAVPQRMAFGGLAATPSFGSGIRESTQIPDLSMTFVPSPTGQGTSGGGHGAGGPPGATASTTTGGQQKSSSPTIGDASAVIKAGRALHHYLATPGTTDPGTAFSGAADNASTLNTQNFLAAGNPDFASTVNGNFGAGVNGANAGDPQGAFVGSTSDSTAGVGATTDEGGISYAGTNIGGGSGIAGGADAGSVYGGGNAGAATGAFGTGASGTAGAGSAGSGAGGLLNAAAPAATADAAAGTGTGAAVAGSGADATLASGVLSSAGAGSTLGAIDGTTVAATVDSAIAASATGSSVASVAPELALFAIAKRGGRINGGMGTRRRYDDGGAVAPQAITGGQTPMQANTATQAPVQQVYNSSYQNMTPEQLQQILTRLPAGSPQQKSAQQVLNTKRMMPNVGQTAQGGFGSQQQQPQQQNFGGQQQQQQQQQPAQSPQGYADGGMADMNIPGGFANDSNGISLDGPPPLNQSMAPSAAGIPTPLSQALMSTSANAVRPAKAKMSIPTPPTPDQVGGDSAFGSVAKPVPSDDKVASNEETSDDSEATEDPNGKAKQISANPWLSLAKAGFTAAAGQSPNFLANLGKGAEAGVSDYETQKVHADSVNQAADKLMQEAEQHKDTLALSQQQADETSRHNQVLEQQSNSEPIKDMFGNVTAILDKKTNKVTPYNDAGSGGSGGGGNIQNIFQPPAGPDGQPLRGEAYLATIPPAVAANARSYKAGLLPPPSSFAAKDPKILASYTAAQNMDPDNAPYLATSYATRQDFAKGPKTAATIQSQNVAMEHLGVLENSIKALNNGDIPAFNKFAQQAAQQMGSPVPTNFDLARTYVSDELNKAVLGGSGAVSDRDKIYNSLSAGSSNQQAMGALETNKHFMAGQALGLDQRYQNGTGESDYRDKYMTPAAQKMYDTYYPLAAPAADARQTDKTVWHSPKGPMVWQMNPATGQPAWTPKGGG